MIGKKFVTIFLVFFLFLSFVPITGNSIDSKPVDDIKDQELKDASQYHFKEHYPSLSELYDWLDTLEEDYPNICKKVKFGESWQGRDLYVMKISDNVGVDEEEPEVLIDGGLHAREWSGPQVASYYMWRVLSGYDSNDTIHWLVNNREIFVAPMLNPDGYVYDGEGDLSEQKMWRKNRNTSTPTSNIGVDLNRNWDIKWSEGDDNPASNTYHGESPHSEYEIKNYTEWILSRDIQSYQNLHSYAGTLLIPWCYTNEESSHDDWYRAMAEDMTSLTSKMGNEDEHYSFGQASETIGYNAPGGANDWVYAATGAHGMCFEIFTNQSGFYPSISQIMKINKDLDDSLIYQTRVADLDLGDGTVHKYPSAPYILYGNVKDVDDTPAEDHTVLLRNLNTSKELEIKTDVNGYFELNLGNLNEEGYSDSDRFLLKCDDEEKKISIDDTWGKKVELELTDFEKPVIDDKSDPGPKTGKEYSFNMVIEDKSEIIKTKIRYKFDNKKIHNEDIVNVKENEYEMTIDVPEDAKELSYNFTAVDLAGNTKITKTKTLEVEDVIKPVAKIGKDISVSIYEDFTLNGDNSYDNIGIKSYRWMIGSETIEGRSISHNYSSLGTEDIKLKVEDHAGNTNSTSIKINVFDKERPEAVAEVDASIDLNEEAVLDATGSSDNGNIINYTWTIEELDKVLYGKNKEVSFESPGRYNIDLKIVDSGNNTDSDFKTIEVFDRTSPEVKVDYRSEVDVGEEIDFDASDSTDNHKIRSYIWDFDDGYKENGEKVKHAFETEGNYTVRLTVEDESGNTITVDHEVTVKKVESEKSSPEKETPGFQIMYLPVGLIIALYIREKKKGR